MEFVLSLDVSRYPYQGGDYTTSPIPRNPDIISEIAHLVSFGTRLFWYVSFVVFFAALQSALSGQSA